MPVINRIADFQDDMTAWRQHLHAHPELNFACHETAAYVTEQLKSFGISEIETGIAESGIVAIIDGQAPGPVIGLRADMDALPIQEVRDLPYKSQNDGVMHACGHDGHTTMLLGAARYLAETRNFAGKVALIFQPAEEGGGGGKVMCDAGIMERYGIGEVYGLHNWPGLEPGAFATTPGAIMAAADEVSIRVIGKGAHGAQPDRGVDPVMVASEIAIGLQMIASRMTPPSESVVVSITQIHAGRAFNVIPEEAELNGTVRTLTNGRNAIVEAQIRQISEGIAAAFGATVEVDYKVGYPVTVNHEGPTARAADAAAEVVGEPRVERDVTPSMGGEDFSYMLEVRPGAYLFLGQGETAGLHHQEYDFNDEILPVGASFFARLVEREQPLAR